MRSLIRSSALLLVPLVIAACVSEPGRASRAAEEFVDAIGRGDSSAIAARIEPGARPENADEMDWSLPEGLSSIGAHVDGNWAVTVLRTTESDRRARIVPVLLRRVESDWLVVFVDFNVAELGLISGGYPDDPIPNTFLMPMRELVSKVWREDSTLQALHPGPPVEIDLHEGRTDARAIRRLDVEGVHLVRITATIEDDTGPRFWLYVRSPEGGGRPSRADFDGAEVFKHVLGDGTYLVAVRADEPVVVRVRVEFLPAPRRDGRDD